MCWLNPASAGAGITVPNIMTFVFGSFSFGGHGGCHAGGLSELCHKYVTHTYDKH